MPRSHLPSHAAELREANLALERSDVFPKPTIEYSTLSFRLNDVTRSVNVSLLLSPFYVTSQRLWLRPIAERWIMLCVAKGARLELETTNVKNNRKFSQPFTLVSSKETESNYCLLDFSVSLKTLLRKRIL